MTTKRIQDLPAVSVLANGDVLPCAQAADGVTRQFTLGQFANAPLVLDFPISNQCQVNHGQYWPGGSLPAFFWEAWCAPRYAAGGNPSYLISDGRGGDHALLWGFSNGTPTGNVWNGTALTSFGADGSWAPGEWGHNAVGWDGFNLYYWMNGVLCGQVAFTGPRYTGFQTLYVGGSDHLNYCGRLAGIRGFEGNMGAGPGGGTYYRQVWSPERFFSNWSNGQDASSYVTFCGNYMAPGMAIPDHSNGYQGTTHPGRIANPLNGAEDLFNVTAYSYRSPMPSWVYDDLCPCSYGPSAATIWGEVIPTAPTTPTGALIYDSFSRANSTYVNGAGNPTLGSTESGSLGPQVWQADAYGSVWGVFQGRAYFGGNQEAAISLTYVDSQTGNHNVAVDRLLGTVSTGETGIVFRYQDNNNYWCLYQFRTGTVYLNKKVAGVATSVASFTPSGYTTLKVNANGSTIKAYTDGTLQSTITDSALSTATKVGLCYSSDYTSRASSIARFDNFTVLAAS